MTNLTSSGGASSQHSVTEGEAEEESYAKQKCPAFQEYHPISVGLALPPLLVDAKAEQEGILRQVASREIEPIFGADGQPACESRGSLGSGRLTRPISEA